MSVISTASPMAAAYSQSKPGKRGGGGVLLDELVEEILVRLPAKSLLRLKATCKTWRSLIESPCFVDFHSRRHRLDHHNCLVISRYDNPKVHSMFSCASSSLISSDDPELTRRPMYEFTWNHPIRYTKWALDFAIRDPDEDDEDEDPVCTELSPYLSILGPLDNGVYCIIHNDSQRPNRVSVATSRIVLGNLATRDLRALNPFPPESAALLTDLARRPSQVHYGFGTVRDVAGVIVDYKVVVVVHSGQDFCRFSSFVYSLKRGGWDKVADVRHATRHSDSESNKAVVGLVNEQGEFETPLLVEHELAGCPQSFLHGAWHWLDTESDRVLRFDFAEEVFGYVEGPPHGCYGDIDEEGCVRSGLFLIDGRLAGIYAPHPWVSEDLRCKRFDVWVMMEYGAPKSWTKIYSCNTAFGGRQFRHVIGLCYTAAARKIRIERVILDDVHTGQLFSWNGADGCRITEHLFHLKDENGLENGLWNTLGISTYVENLESLTLPRSPHN